MAVHLRADANGAKQDFVCERSQSARGKQVMKKSITGKLAIVLLAVILGACATGGDIKQTEDSGFLRDYSVMQEAKDAQGKTVRAWVSPKTHARPLRRNTAGTAPSSTPSRGRASR